MASSVEDVLPLTPLQQGMVFHALLGDRADVYTVQTVLRLTEDVDPERMRGAAEALVRRHANLRAAFRTQASGQFVQVIRRSVAVPFRVVGEMDFDADRAEPFDLARPPLLRFTLVGKRILVLTAHHLLWDGWSAPVLVRELLALYEGRPLPPVRPYREHLTWLSKQDTAAAERAWAKALSELDEPTLVGGSAAGFPRRTEFTVDGRALEQAARDHGVTANAVVQGAWALTLSVLTGRDDLVFGATVSGRSAEVPGVESMVGMFINTVPVRVRLSPRESLAALFARVQAEQALLLEHQHLGLADIQRVSGHASLFDTLVVFESYPMDGEIPLLADVSVRDATHYPLALLVVPGEEFMVRIDHDPAQFPTVSLIAQCFQDVLGRFVAAPDTPVSRLDLFVEETPFHAEPIPPTTLPELIEAQVARTPDATAVVFEGERLTYAELDARASVLAGQLAAAGVGPDSIVGVRQDRSLELVVSLLAVLKAGGAYLPLDPSYPEERLEFMISDARPVVVLPAPLSGQAEARKPGPDNAAYVIYTSGSTGRPKGVVVSHRAIVNRLLWMQHEYGLTPEDAVLQKTPSSFDVSVWEFFWPLITGATLVVAKPGGHKDPDYLAEVIEQVTTVHFVPSMLRAYGDRPLPKRVFCSGEALSADIAKPGMHNLYGPTEAAVDVTHWTVTDEVAIGRPVWNTQVHVLDRMLRPAMVGELYLGGVQLARGYLNRPGLTAERFVAGPNGERLYRTGDLVRWDNGVLHYLGRTDDQVKIRGFRVELGEVEAALTALPGVKAAAAAVQAERQQLIGYVVADDPLDPSALRLPEHLTPSAIVTLDALPLTPSGKLDRKALPQPHFETGITQARDPREEILCELFADVLGLDTVGPHDDFFALGGHSLLATKLASRVRRTFSVDLKLRTVFDAPTAARLARLLDEGVRRPALTKRQRPAEIPLSPAQRSLWFLYRLEGPNPTYNIPFAARLEGPLDTNALDAALKDVVERHESLRTIFPGTEPRQEILEPRRIERGAAEHSFRLDEELPIRCDLRRTGDNEHEFVLVVHHIAADEWSARPLLRDLGVAYAARLEGKPPDWPPLPVQYADYTLWQLENTSDDKEFWSRQLDGLPEELPLPTDRPRPRTPGRRGGSVRLKLPDTRQLARTLGVTDLMVGQAAVAVLLHRLGAGDDIPLGTPTAGRGDEALDDLVGFFVNTLVLRTDLSGNPTFRELLSRVRETNLDAYSHQDLPFERVVETLNPARSPGRHPLFQTMVSHQDPAGAELTLTGITTTPLDPGVTGAKFDLAFHFAPGECAISYSADLFEESTVEGYGKRLARLLEAFTADPSHPIGLVDILAPAEHAQLRAFNDTAETRPATTLTAMVEEQVTRTPDAIAVEFHDEKLTYAELDARANQVARTLRDLGVGLEKTVGMHWERSIEMVVGLLGVEKAGGAFVPLEPSWPRHRIAEVCASAGLAAILSGEKHDEPVRDLGVPVVHIDESTSDRLDVHIEPESLAYVIYTSGSTGTPKGAMIRHRAITHRLLWQREMLGFGPCDASLFKAPLGFDISINEIFLPLVTGGKLVIAEPGGERDIDYLLGLIEGHQVTFTYLPSSILDLLLRIEEFPEKGRSLKHVWCGGEVLTPELFQRFRRGSDAVMYHGYGPAEATIGVSHVVYRDPDAIRGAVSIGKPNGNTRLHVLDRNLLPVPVGVPGELYAGGVYLGRGYLNDPKRTADHFVADPFGPPGSRLYRTGDLARWQSDGSLEFLGRADNQIKIRGMRVELEEIEAVLEQHEDIGRAVVLVREDRPGLVGYCLGPKVDGIGDWLRTRLPEHMVPQRFVCLDEFPLLPSGKVNRRALPEPAPDETTTRMPVTATEKVLCGLMAELLRLPEVGAEDNFFALGGDSILSIRFVSKARAAGLQISPRQVFEHQTAAALARTVDAASATAHDDGVGQVPLTPIMHWWTETGDDAMHQAALLRVPEPFAPDAFEQVLQDVLDHHDLLRSRLDDGGLHVPPPGSVKAVVEHVDGPYRPEKYTEAVAALDPADSMVRAVASDGRLLLVLHHLVVDGVSWRILAEDLAEAWKARAEGRPPALAPVPTSFRTWALATARPTVVPAKKAARNAGRLTVELGVPETRKVLEGKHSRIHEVLVFALGQALGPTVVALEGHGREEHLVPGADLSRTVGWFTTVFPVELNRPTLTQVKEQLRAIPDNGFGAAVPDTEVSFNYLGRFDLSEDYWTPGPEKLPEPRLQHRPLEINAVTEDGPDGPVLKATWSWTDKHTEAEVGKFARVWLQALSGEAEVGLTPSDVPLVSLNQGQLDKLAAKWGKKK